MKAKRMDGQPIFVGKSISGSEMIDNILKREAEENKYIAETGLCPACKTEPVVEGQMRCQTCIDKTNEILKQLYGNKGFMAF